MHHCTGLLEQSFTDESSNDKSEEISLPQIPDGTPVRQLIALFVTFVENASLRPEACEPATFFENYQICRYLSLVEAAAESRMILIFPKLHVDLERGVSFLNEKASECMEGIFQIKHLEQLVLQINDRLKDESSDLAFHFREFQKKYILDPPAIS